MLLAISSQLLAISSQRGLVQIFAASMERGHLVRP
jgi:hypothetical protein